MVEVDMRSNTCQKGIGGGCCYQPYRPDQVPDTSFHHIACRAPCTSKSIFGEPGAVSRVCGI